MISALLLRFWPYIAGAVAVAAVAALIGAYQAGVHAERNRGEVVTLRVQIETLRRDKEIAEHAQIRNAEAAAELAAANKENEEQIDALHDIIANRADRGLNQSELDGLLNIR